MSESALSGPRSPRADGSGRTCGKGKNAIRFAYSSSDLLETPCKIHLGIKKIIAEHHASESLNGIRELLVVVVLRLLTFDLGKNFGANRHALGPLFRARSAERSCSGRFDWSGWLKVMSKAATRAPSSRTASSI